MVSKWKVLVGAIVVATFLTAQQPIQLQTYNGGGAVALGHGTAATALRVELPTDGTGTVVLGTGGNVIGQVNQGTSPWVSITSPQTSATYAFTRYHSTSSTSVAQNVKASAGNVYGFSVFNPNNSPCYFQLYNNAGVPTVGTGVVDSYGVQAGQTLTVPPGTIALANYAAGIAYATGTTDSGSGVCTTAVSVTLYYQ